MGRGKKGRGARAVFPCSATFTPARTAGMMARHHTEGAMSESKRKTRLRKSAGGRAAHDVGGLLDFGPIDRTEHDPALWEKRIDAMLILLVGPKKGAFKIDAMRRVIEDYGQQEYDATTYYQKWARAIRNLLIEQEIVTRDELDRKFAAVAADFEHRGRHVAAKAIP